MTHGMRLMPITTAYAINIFNGDLVKSTSGLIVKDTGTATALPLGVFLGCEYEDTALGLFHRQLLARRRRSSRPVLRHGPMWLMIPIACSKYRQAEPITQAMLV